MSIKHRDSATDVSGITVNVPVRVLFDRGLWAAYCEATGTNEWALNEGRMDMDDTVTITEEQARSIGIWPEAPRAYGW